MLAEASRSLGAVTPQLPSICFGVCCEYSGRFYRFAMILAVYKSPDHFSRK